MTDIETNMTPETGEEAPKKKRAAKKKSPDELAAALPFEARSARLEEVVRLLESGTLPLEESLALYEEGVALVRASTKELDEAEQRVSVLHRTPEGGIRPAAFLDTEDGRA